MIQFLTEMLTRNHILVVDDDAAVRRLTCVYLENCGFSVLEADGGHQAISVFLRNFSSVTLLLSDVVMPEMTGPELAAELLRFRPDLPVLFMTGGCGNLVDALKGYGCVPKPFLLRELLENVRGLLAQSPAPSPA